MFKKYPYSDIRKINQNLLKVDFMKCQFWNSYKSFPKIIDIGIFRCIKLLNNGSNIKLSTQISDIRKPNRKKPKTKVNFLCEVWF